MVRKMMTRRRALAAGASGFLGLIGLGCDDSGRPHPALGPAVSIARLFIKLPWLRYLDIGLTVFEVVDSLLQVSSLVKGTRRDQYQQKVTPAEVDYLKAGGAIEVEWRDGVKTQTSLGRHTSFGVEIWDSLGHGQIREELTVDAGGVVQSLELTLDDPIKRMVFQAPFVGDYPAVLHARTWFDNGAIVDGVGQGVMTVSGPCGFDLCGSYEFAPCRLTLEPRSR